MSGGSKKRVTVGYKYYIGVHFVLCHGPIDKLVRIDVDEKQAWTGTGTTGTITISQPDLFGGEQREGGVAGNIDIALGHSTQSRNAYLQARLGSAIPAYRGVVSVILRQFYIGLNPYLKRWAFWAERIHIRTNGDAQWYDAKAAIGTDMNPAHIIHECLTDAIWGMGHPIGDLDNVSFTAAADQLFTEGMGMSLLWDKSMTIEEFIELVLKHIDGSLYVDRNTGKFVLKLARGGYDVNTLLTLDENNIEKISDFKRNTVGELVNSVTAIYLDGGTGKPNSVTVQDIALAAQQGATIGTTKQFPGFTNGTMASRAASRTLKALSIPLASATIYANREAASLNIGDVFKLSWAPYGLVQIVMRVANIELGSLGKNIVKVTCVEDAFGLDEAVYAAPPLSEWSVPTNAPAQCPYYAVHEATYWEMVQRVGETEAEAKDITASFIVATGVRPSDDASNAKLFTNPTTTIYEEAGTVDFCPTALNTNAAGYTDTVIALDTVVDVDSSSVQVNTYAVWGNEIVRVDVISETSMTVARGCLDTVPILHAAGERIFFADAYYESDSIEYVDGETARIKLLPSTAEGTLDISAATEQTLLLGSRLSRPYAPGRLSLNTTYYKDSVPGDADLVIDWKHRDRLQQTASLIGSDVNSNIGPEAGTTYTVELLTLAGSAISSASGLTGTTHTFTVAAMGANYGRLRIRLRAVRSGLDSYRIHDYEFTRSGYGTGYGYSYGGSS